MGKTLARRDANRIEAWHRGVLVCVEIAAGSSRPCGSAAAGRCAVLEDAVPSWLMACDFVNPECALPSEETTMNDVLTLGPRKWLMTACILAMSAGIAIAQEPARKVPGAKPATGAAKRASIYDKAADAKVQVARAVERAKKDDKRILLMFGGDWCGWCHKLHGLFQTNREVATILYNEYVLVTIDTESPNAAPLLATCKDGPEPGRPEEGLWLSLPGRARYRRQAGQGAADRRTRGGRPSRPEEGRGFPQQVEGAGEGREARPRRRPGAGVLRRQAGLPDLRRPLVRLVSSSPRLDGTARDRGDPRSRLRHRARSTSTA